jgi:hypothetical protein
MLGFVASDIQTVANDAFLEANPAAASILENVTLDVTTVSEMVVRMARVRTPTPPSPRWRPSGSKRTASRSTRGSTRRAPPRTEGLNPSVRAPDLPEPRTRDERHGRFSSKRARLATNGSTVRLAPPGQAAS